MGARGKNPTDCALRRDDHEVAVFIVEDANDLTTEVAHKEGVVEAAEATIVAAGLAEREARKRKSKDITPRRTQEGLLVCLGDISWWQRSALPPGAQEKNRQYLVGMRRNMVWGSAEDACRARGVS